MNWYSILKTSTYDISQNPAFMAWFGASKVVDAQGKPLRVYKGMYPYDYSKEDKAKGYPGPEIEQIQRPQSFPTFDPKDQEPVHLAGFFTDDPEVARGFMFGQSAMYAVYLRIENPKIFDAKKQYSGTIQFEEGGRPFRDAIRSGKYDGVFILNTADEGNVYIPLSPYQIKSATGNSGSFNREDPRLVA